MRNFLILVIALPAACSASPAEQAERQYNIVIENSGGWDARCEAAEKVRDAHLEAEDRDGHLTWTIRSNADCAQARVVARP